MYTLSVVLVILASILMCGIVLIQESKGGGLASSFSSSNQIMGVKKTTDFLEKATWTLAIAMVVLSVVSAGFVEKSSNVEEIIELQAPTQQAPVQVPTAEAPATETPAEAPATTPEAK
ncbi:MAG: preprotein translocase subunit SecG [Bacteroidaceae bacterium]|nr:preprotein translocase subunit SecG [Bacteroidaceae bacterium]